MKTACLFPLLLACAPPVAGQSLVSSRILSESTHPLGPDESRTEVIRYGLDDAGQSVQITNSYVTLATSLNRWDETREEWVAAVPEFEQTEDGYYVARQTRTMLILPPDLSAEPVDMLTYDGVRMISSPIGVAMVDLSTGDTALLGDLQPCQAEWVAPDTLVYRHALRGIDADIVYQISLAGIEQYVVLREWVPTLPEDLRMNPAHLRVQVYTDFFDAPEPTARLIKLKETDPTLLSQRVWEPELIDRELKFGTSTRMIPGRAFAAGEQDVDAPTAKSWETAGTRRVLCESCDYVDVAQWLLQLPAPASVTTYEGVRLEPGRMVPANLPERQAARPRWASLPFKNRLQDRAWASVEPNSLKAMDTASYLAASGPGLVLDYTTISADQSNYTCDGTQTYYITASVHLSGTTRLEGGTVIKFMQNGSTPRLYVEGALDCDTDASRPAIFTAEDDNTVGTTIAESSGTPSGYYAYVALYCYNTAAAIEVKHVQVRHSTFGIAFYQNTSNLLRHGQFVKCMYPVYVTSAGTVNVQNVLIYGGLGGSGSAFRASAANSIVGEHVTVNDVPNLLTITSGSPTLSLKNSLLVDVDTIQTYTGSYTEEVSSSTGVFQTVGVGGHYLAPGSPYRNAGLATIDSDLADELEGLTTYPPQVMSSSISADTTLVQQAARDIDDPDLGFHYIPVDYIADEVALTAKLTLTEGVVLGLDGTYGLGLGNGSDVESEGRVGRPNRIVSLASVQEAPTAKVGRTFMRITSSSAMPEMIFRFTEFALGQGDRGTLLDLYSTSPFTKLEMRDCQVYGGYFSLAPYTASSVTLSMNNNLLERCYLWFYHSIYSQNTPFYVSSFNNLLRNGTLGITCDSGTYNPSWYVRDNLFDGTGQTLYGGAWSTYVQRGYNGFISGTSNSLGGGGTNKEGLNPDYQTAGLGDFYYPNSGSSPSLAVLLGAGSRAATAAGLYHHTVRADETVEGSGTVDIGFHYVATATDAATGADLPLDTDGDGIPDYVEDGDGDNVLDSGETNWQNSENGTTGAPGLVVFTPLE